MMERHERCKVERFTNFRRHSQIRLQENIENVIKVHMKINHCYASCLICFAFHMHDVYLCSVLSDMAY